MLTSCVSPHQGVLWARTKDYKCGPEYDPTVRPWFVSGSNGPKNVIFILDSSGSMQSPLHAPRMDMLKKATNKLIEGLTMSDFVSIVDFDDSARTYLNLNYMARAKSSFRAEMKKFVDKMEAGGSTSYDKAFELAFKVADNSYAQNYDSGCQTVYVFLTDGASPEDPTSRIKARQQQQPKRKEMYVIIGLGSEVSPTSGPGIKLKQLACTIGGVFESVSDLPQGATPERRAAT